MSTDRAIALLREALSELETVAPAPYVPPVVPTPVEPGEPPIATGDSLVVWGEVRVKTPAIFSGFFTQKVTLTVLPMGGGGRPILVELIANGQHMGNGPNFTLEPGSYQLILKGGSQIPGAMQSVMARPA